MSVKESGEMYLETILRLQKELSAVHSVDIAKALNVSKPSVSRAIQILLENDYITLGEHKTILLSETGKQLATSIFERHEILKHFLISIGVPSETAETDACRMEHIISEETFEKIKSHYNSKK
ncbi:MAG: metal-dependent transcriptional regulator [Fibrobacteraceae bacterium]|jgi:Mn-dependent DtxR family transcriptional regulator|nr:metal-dependent transcriptional regulator [Fibrobacteraceae bacterium]MBQ5610369.1 metal-dependent transcriptional regulator [Fibrobacteraceae bacterium]MEE1276050.1 metal-dependent transcriptional regulator [Fibrobacteraceae bacterium]